MPGYKDKAQGKAKKVVGRTTRNRDMEGRGVVQETKGRVKSVAGKVKREVRAGTRSVRRPASRPARRRRV